MFIKRKVVESLGFTINIRFRCTWNRIKYLIVLYKVENSIVVTSTKNLSFESTEWKPRKKGSHLDADSDSILLNEKSEFFCQWLIGHPWLPCDYKLHLGSYIRISSWHSINMIDSFLKFIQIGTEQRVESLMIQKE